MGSSPHDRCRPGGLLFYIVKCYPSPSLMFGKGSTVKRVLSMNKLQQIKTDASATINCTAMGKEVNFTHSVKVEQDTKVRYNLNWTFDFATVAQSEILKLAARSMLIRKQGEWRKAKNRLDADVWDEVTFDVESMLAEGRKSADPVTKVVNAVAKMSQAEKADLLALLQK